MLHAVGPPGSIVAAFALMFSAAYVRGGDTYAFVDVNVIPMTGRVVLRQQTVVVAEDTIVAIGPSACVPIPADAVTIDGRGRSLMLGLTDAHGGRPQRVVRRQSAPNELRELVVQGKAGERPDGRRIATGQQGNACCVERTHQLSLKRERAPELPEIVLRIDEFLCVRDRLSRAERSLRPDLARHVADHEHPSGFCTRD